MVPLRTITVWFGAVIVLAVMLYLGRAPILFAQTAEEVQAQIDASNAQIQRLREEIAQLQSQLNATSKEKQTLQTAVRNLDLSIQTLSKSISLTNAQIAAKDREIKSISGDILTTSEKIHISEQGVASALRQLVKLDAQSPAAVLLTGSTLSEYYSEAYTFSSLRNELQITIEDLSHLKDDLQVDKTAAEGKRRELARLQGQLSEERQGLTAARAAQNQLLTQTANKESNYQALIADKKAQEEKFEQDLQNFEAQLNLIVNPGSFTAPKAGVLRWPVANPYITQYFGNTPFATANAQVYGGKGHNAIDLRASVGTPVRAAQSGTVRGQGNTDATCPNASYGKWVFIDHPGGLSTLYAHLSVISVESGQGVAAGEVIGYSGNTGYSTGPHLHFGVYATSGSKIASFPSQSCRGRTYTMPVADPTAYLNPLSYLPAI